MKNILKALPLTTALSLSALGCSEKPDQNIIFDRIESTAQEAAMDVKKIEDALKEGTCKVKSGQKNVTLTDPVRKREDTYMVICENSKKSSSFSYMTTEEVVTEKLLQDYDFRYVSDDSYVDIDLVGNNDPISSNYFAFKGSVSNKKPDDVFYEVSSSVDCRKVALTECYKEDAVPNPACIESLKNKEYRCEVNDKGAMYLPTNTTKEIGIRTASLRVALENLFKTAAHTANWNNGSTK